MDRGIRAPLSPNEEATLRRVAQGIATRDEVRAADLAHLIHLLLVEEIDGRLTLSALGRQRYQLLPKAPGAADLAEPRALHAVLKRSLRQDEP
jgi:hypothetical protein